MQRFIFSVALVLASLSAGPALAQEKLAWKFKEGEKFYLEERTMIKQSIKVLGNNEEKEEAQYNLVSFKVHKKTEDGVVLIETLEELKADVQKGKADPNGQQLLDKMRGHQFTITLNNKGQITMFDGYDSLIGKLSGGDANVEKTFRAVLPIDFFKKTSEQMFTMMPDKAVKKGDSWKRETQLSMGPIGGFKATHSYKYDGAVNGVAAILTTAKLDYTVPTGDGAGLPFKITKGTLVAENAKGRFLFDIANGRPSQTSMSMVIRGGLTMDIADMSVDVDLFMEQSSTSRVLATRPDGK